jgi:hypothetical protein
MVVVPVLETSLFKLSAGTFFSDPFTTIQTNLIVFGTFAF